MNQVIEKLKSLYFSETEALIYVYLLQQPGQTLYQIQTNVHLTKKQALDHTKDLINKGVLLLEEGPKELYYAEKPEDLLNKLKTKYIHDTDDLMHELTHMHQNYHQDPYFNLHGFDEIIGEARTMIYGAKDEIYINTDIDISLLDEAFRFLEQKGVDIHIFSFRAQQSKRMNVNLYTYGYESLESTRIMLVVDMHKVMIANKHPLTKKWSATITKNELMNRIITEHIHHDIYLYRIINQNEKTLFELYPELRIHSKFEKQMK